MDFINYNGLLNVVPNNACFENGNLKPGVDFNEPMNYVDQTKDGQMKIVAKLSYQKEGEDFKETPRITLVGKEAAVALDYYISAKQNNTKNPVSIVATKEQIERDGKTVTFYKGHAVQDMHAGKEIMQTFKNMQEALNSLEDEPTR